MNISQQHCRIGIIVFRFCTFGFFFLISFSLDAQWSLREMYNVEGGSTTVVDCNTLFKTDNYYAGHPMANHQDYYRYWLMQSLDGGLTNTTVWSSSGTYAYSIPIRYHSPYLITGVGYSLMIGLRIKHEHPDSTFRFLPRYFSDLENDSLYECTDVLSNVLDFNFDDPENRYLFLRGIENQCFISKQRVDSVIFTRKLPDNAFRFSIRNDSSIFFLERNLDPSIPFNTSISTGISLKKYNAFTKESETLISHDTAYINDIFFNKTTLKLWAVGAHGRLVNSDDLGVSWNTIPMDTSFDFKRIIKHHDKLYICDYGGKLFSSQDEGQTWDIVDFPLKTKIYGFFLTGDDKLGITTRHGLYIFGCPEINYPNNDSPEDPVKDVSELKFYPNPSLNEPFTVQVPQFMTENSVATISIVRIDGSLIKSALLHPGEISFEIQALGIGSGYYFVVVDNQRTRLAKPFVLIQNY